MAQILRSHCLTQASLKLRLLLPLLPKYKCVPLCLASICHATWLTKITFRNRMPACTVATKYFTVCFWFVIFESWCLFVCYRVVLVGPKHSRVLEQSPDHHGLCQGHCLLTDRGGKSRFGGLRATSFFLDSMERLKEHQDTSHASRTGLGETTQAASFIRKHSDRGSSSLSGSKAGASGTGSECEPFPRSRQGPTSWPCVGTGRRQSACHPLGTQPSQ